MSRSTSFAVRVCWNAHGEINTRTVGLHATTEGAQEQIDYLTLEDDEWTAIVEIDDATGNEVTR